MPRPATASLLASLLPPVPAFAAAADEPGWLAASLVHLVLLLAAVLAVLWTLGRLERRLPRLIARRSRGGMRTTDLVASWEQMLRLLLLPLKVALWLGAGYLLSEHVPALHDARSLLSMVAVKSLQTPFANIDGKAYTAIDLLILPALLIATWLGVSLLTRLLRSQLFRPLGVERGIEDALAFVLRALLTVVGCIVALQLWGFDVSSLAILASFLGVGIGFGVRNLANNFVSGLVLNVERPIRPGDFLNVGKLSGTVERVGARCTEIRTIDRVSILVPNSHLLENDVINWTHGDPTCRLHVPVHVAYGSDIARVRRALLESARNHPNILSDPRPLVEFHGFEDSSLAFELLVWTRQPHLQNHLKSDLNFRIEANLRHHGVHVPFPQRDLHLRSPQIDRLLTLVARSYAGGSEIDKEAVALNPAPAPVTPALGAELEEESGPRQWSEAEIEALVDRIRGREGIAICDRRHLLRVYPRCFVGREAVDWLVGIGLTRQEAVELGQILIDRDIIHHVLDEHTFKDGHFFYRFLADENGAAAMPRFGVAVQPGEGSWAESVR